MAACRDRNKLSFTVVRKRLYAIKHLAVSFPLNSIDKVVALFRDQLSSDRGPNLALLSIVLGAVEHQLTRDIPQTVTGSHEDVFSVKFDEVDVLYEKFLSILTNSVKADELASCQHDKVATVSSRLIVRKVSDVIWSLLHSSYHKDRAHMQSVYNLLTESKLDCFGVAVSVVAACQLLGLDDVHLVMSEDHVWVAFGEQNSETMEVTWHGKGIEDKRGQPVTADVLQKSWLYLGGNAVICTRHMELAAMVSSIHPAISSSTDSIHLTALQLRLLWLLYDAGHLDRYPVVISQLGDLCEPSSSVSRPTPLLLYQKAISSAKTYYRNMHVYPHTYVGHYYYRNRQFREALSAWADAADVISQYNYNRDDEEVYKELFEIANLMLPQILRMESKSLQNDAIAFSQLLRFYDGICLWEEDSITPVLHITWATHMLSSVSKFDPITRSRVKIVLVGDTQQNSVDEDSSNGRQSSVSCNRSKREVKLRTRRIEVETHPTPEQAYGHPDLAAVKPEFQHESRTEQLNRCSDEKLINQERTSTESTMAKAANDDVSTTLTFFSNTFEVNALGKKCGEVKGDNESDCLPRDEPADQLKHITIVSTFFKEPNNTHQQSAVISNKSVDKTVQTVSVEELPVESDDDNDDRNSEIAALAHGCCDKLLNPEFLRGSGKPFFEHHSQHQLVSVVAKTQMDLSEFTGGNSCLASPAEQATVCNTSQSQCCNNSIISAGIEPPVVYLRSVKMKEIGNLLVARKLNSNAITLQLTAQSQVHLRHPATAGGRPLNKRQKLV